MNRVVRELGSDHELIGRAAACLERLADEALETGELHVYTAIELLEFFEHFVDGAHQEKEEQCLFPALLERGLPGHGVRELLADHEREREVLTSMRSSLAAATKGDAASRNAYAHAALDYALMQREHVALEDRFLLPLVDELLGSEAQHEVLVGFREVDEAILARPREHYFVLVHEIAARLGSSYSSRVLSVI